MSEWVEYKLGDLITLKTGKLNSNAAAPEGKYPFFTCSPETLKIDTFAFDEEALLLAGNNANGVFSLKYYKGKFNAYQRTYVITVNESIDYKFLYYSVKQQLSNLVYISHGTATKFLTLPIINTIPILLPPLPEQKAIAAVLSSLDDKIDLLHRQNKTLEAMAETLFRQWFVEEADEGWEEGKLGDLIELIYGKALKDEVRTGAGFPVVGSSGVVGYHSEYIVTGPGIVIGRKGTLGKVTYLNGNFFPIDTTYYVKSKSGSIGMLFEYFLLKTIAFDDMNSDSAVPGLNRDIALSAELKIPPLDLIQEFSSACISIMDKKESNTKQIRTLEKLRDTLLPKLMSGEVRVAL